MREADGQIDRQIETERQTGKQTKWCEGKWKKNEVMSGCKEK